MSRDFVESRAKQLADQVHAFLEDACHDLVHTVDLEFFTGKTAEAIKVAQARGERDLKGWLVCYLYNDAEVLKGFASDKIADLADGDGGLAQAIRVELEILLPQLKEVSGE